MREGLLEHIMDGEPGVAELGAALQEITGRTGRLIAASNLHKGVYRISLMTRGRPLSLVAKRLAAPVAYRNQLTLERWLPAAGLEHAAPVLIGVAAERGGHTVWHLYEDLGDATLEATPIPRGALEATVRLVAAIHARFAEDPVLAECRLWGEDHSIAFYDSSVRDAISAVGAVLDCCQRPPRAPAGERLLARLERLSEERDARARALAEFGGPNTLLHGDLWPKNAAILRATEMQEVRLIDWDHVGPGSFAYDLSTLALRVPGHHRAELVDLYRRFAAELGMPVPADGDLEVLFTTAECARLANVAIWPALIAAKDGSGWAFQELAAIDEWLEHAQARCAA
jgi:hypothetical protein